MRRRLVSLSHLPKNQTKQKENSKMYKQSTNQHHTENKMQIWKIVEEKSQCESKFQKSKIKNQKIKKSQREWKKTFGNVLDFTDRRVEKEPFGNLVLLLVAQLCFFNVRHFSLSLCFGSVGDFEKELNLRFVFCLCVFVVEGRKRIRIWSGPLVWFGGVCVMRDMDGRDCLGPTEVSNQTHVVWDL